LLILKNLDDDDKGICKSFFPPMFGEDTNTNEGSLMTKEDKKNVHNKYLEVKNDYLTFRNKANNSYDYYNLIEKSVLEMEGEE